ARSCFDPGFGDPPSERAVDDLSPRFLAIGKRRHAGVGTGGCAADRPSPVESAAISPAAVGRDDFLTGGAAEKLPPASTRAMDFTGRAGSNSLALCLGPG